MDFCPYYIHIYVHKRTYMHSGVNPQYIYLMISSLQLNYIGSVHTGRRLHLTFIMLSLPTLPSIMSLCLLNTFSFFFNVYSFLRVRETEHERGRGRERGRHRIGSRLQALSSQHRARRGAQTHELRDHDLSQSWTLN